MKKLSLLIVSLFALIALGGSVAPQQITFSWTWKPDPNDLGGLSTSDYYTNITFNLWTSTNVTTPTANWVLATNWPASPLTVDSAGNWTASANLDGQTRFYLLTVNALGGGQSPFSNLASWVAKPPPGLLKSVK
jgi:hypothetical protein